MGYSEPYRIMSAEAQLSDSQPRDVNESSYVAALNYGLQRVGPSLSTRLIGDQSGFHGVRGSSYSRRVPTKRTGRPCRLARRAVFVPPPGLVPEAMGRLERFYTG